MVFDLLPVLFAKHHILTSDFGFQGYALFIKNRYSPIFGFKAQGVSALPMRFESGDWQGSEFLNVVKWCAIGPETAMRQSFISCFLVGLGGAKHFSRGQSSPFCSAKRSLSPARVHKAVATSTKKVHCSGRIAGPGGGSVQILEFRCLGRSDLHVRGPSTSV